ncbi:EAL domain-containing protein [Actinoplanes bogorensis]|uniref:EAL domain-containing protein n=1 Tax=Paractinoplanes bogorensis TaxID=1610840 RepID=A0ABS5Z2R7_9ACTN|nr:EAL domain-containing protein [Actinoplanes bogorensis]
MQVAAEWVQDGETVELLRTYGVDFVQGYWCGRPVPIAAGLAPPTESIEMEIRLPAQRVCGG